jgi:hypothetical protein
MTASTRRAPNTLVEAIAASIARALRTAEGVAPPAAVLWTDQEGQWRPLIPRLRCDMPALFTLGAYDPASRTGPTIWLKCIVGRTIEGSPGPDLTPILYLPGVSRQELRAGGDCRPACQPLIELLYRGRAWHQENGKDWSVEAFLVSEEGVGLDVAKDTLTRDAILRALPVLATTSLDALRGTRLEAQDFDRLTIPDPVRDVLRWLADPAAFKTDLDAARWNTFCQVCRTNFGIELETVEPGDVARALVEGVGRWEEVWQRFREAPRLYRGVSTLLRESDLTSDKLPFDDARLPRINDEGEADLKAGLEAVARLPHQEACARVLALEREHGARRTWVWSELGQSPLSNALLPLTRLATLATLPATGTSLDTAVAWYAADGWRCDRAALDALALPLSPAHGNLVAAAVRALYEPWLDRTARAFQAIVLAQTGRLGRPVASEPAGREVCFLFADGLRFDVAALLQEKLEGRELRARLVARLAPVPTVTATAKPLASPVSDAVSGHPAADDFTPVLAGSSQAATITRLRAEMNRRGIDVMAGDDLHVPSTATTIGWSECGHFDELGHKLGVGLAHQIDQEVEAVADRVVALLDCGWPRVRVVTDHGWLLLPGGLPKVDLPSSTTEAKWARCASVRGDSQPSAPVFAWHWHPDVRIATPPGIGSFFANSEYAHGGLSFQECVVPELVVERPAGVVKVSITDVTWRGMRLRIRINPPVVGVRVDLRRNWKQESSSLVASAKEFDANGEASVVVVDDKDEGTAATIVLLDASGNALDRKQTTVGEN